MKAGRGKSKQIQSPNFPQKYANKLDCMWMFVSNGNSLLSARINIEVVGTAGSRDKLIIQKSLEVSRSDSQVHEYYGKTKRNKALTLRNTPGFTIKFVSNRGNRGKGFSLNVVALAQGNSFILLTCIIVIILILCRSSLSYPQKFKIWFFKSNQFW